jgi:hypothetical protein
LPSTTIQPPPRMMAYTSSARSIDGHAQRFRRPAPVRLIDAERADSELISEPSFFSSRGFQDRVHDLEGQTARHAGGTSDLRGPWVALLRRSNKQPCQCTLVGARRPGPVGLHDPLVGRPKRQLDARAHLALLRFWRDEHSAKSRDVFARIDRVVVRPAARPVVRCCPAQLRRHCRPYRRWIGSFLEQNCCFVNVRSELGGLHAGVTPKRTGRESGERRPPRARRPDGRPLLRRSRG